MSAAMGPDEIAEALLSEEAGFEPREWAAIENGAVQLLVEARAHGVDPREHAAQLLVSLEATLNDDAPLDPDEEDRRVDAAMAAALVYAGRIV